MMSESRSRATPWPAAAKLAAFAAVASHAGTCVRCACVVGGCVMWV